MADEQIKITIQDTESIWKSPDGEREIFAVKVEDGTIYKTWSGKFSAMSVGTEVDVNTYVKKGRDGEPEHWISLPDKGGRGGRGYGGGGSRGGNKSFALSYAKDIVIAECQFDAENQTGMVDVDRCIEIAEKFNGWLEG